jgi:glycosyltransferase involved in cell wall biosynthesis
LAVSETDRREIESYLPASRGKTAVTFNACPPWIQRHDPQEAKSRLLTELGIDRPYLLTTGTRWARKNMELAVSAMKSLSSQFPHLLVVSGKGDWSTSELGDRCLATGYVPNEQLSLLYSGADLYLAPSRHEGFGIPLLEAFRCGCPVLCSSGGAFPEVAGGAAQVEPGWDAAQWAFAIERLLLDSSKLQTLSQAGIRRERAFGWDETARRTLEIYLHRDPDGRQTS